MSKPGWYPDPGGQAGMYRWWDGQTWTPHLTGNPYAPPQPAAQPAASGHLPMRDAATASQDPYAAYRQAETQRSSRGPLLVLVIVGVLLAGMIWGVIALLGGGRGLLPGGDIGSNPTENFCPPRTIEVSPRPHTAASGRVQGGALSYPQLGSPWGPVAAETRVPFGSDVWGQSVLLHSNYDNSGSDWVASLIVGELVAGDGFFSPEQGAEIVSRCVLGEFYGDAPLSRTDRVNEATTVDGHDAWVVEMHLTFSIAALNETGETAIIVIVNTGEESSSLYYASIPDSRPDLLVTAREIQTQLRVEA